MTTNQVPYVNGSIESAPVEGSSPDGVGMVGGGVVVGVVAGGAKAAETSTVDGSDTIGVSPPTAAETVAVLLIEPLATSAAVAT
jgi:hypothetical protein